MYMSTPGTDQRSLAETFVEANVTEQSMRNAGVDRRVIGAVGRALRDKAGSRIWNNLVSIAESELSGIQTTDHQKRLLAGNLRDAFSGQDNPARDASIQLIGVISSRVVSSPQPDINS